MTLLVKVWSDSDPIGIDVTVTESGYDSGAFNGTVYFASNLESRAIDHSTFMLKAKLGDGLTAEHIDKTVPQKNEFIYESEIVARASIDSPLVGYFECCNKGFSDFRVADAFGNSLSTVSVNQKVQLAADIGNGKNKDQPFAYIIQIKDINDVVVALESISGMLSPDQSFSPALSWNPTEAGSYNATTFYWSSINDHPALLANPIELKVIVGN